MSNTKYMMTIVGLLVESVEMQILRFSFGLVANQSLNTPPPLMPAKSQTSMIERDSDKSSIRFYRASRKAMQVIVAEIEQLKEDLLNRVTYSFSNAVIRSIHSIGTVADGFTESLQFDSEEMDNDYSHTPFGCSSYKGSHKGKQK